MPINVVDIFYVAIEGKKSKHMVIRITKDSDVIYQFDNFDDLGNKWKDYHTMGLYEFCQYIEKHSLKIGIV